MWKKDTSIHPSGSWLLVHDTGSFLDFNQWADFTKKGFVFGQVFSTGSGWQIDFSNISASWGPPQTPQTAMTIFPTAFGTSTDGSGQFNATNLASTNAKAFTVLPFNFNNLVGINQIRDLIETLHPGDFTLDQRQAIEDMTRPLYCYLSVLLAQLRDRGVL
jgi:hypothetical protein